MLMWISTVNSEFNKASLLYNATDCKEITPCFLQWFVKQQYLITFSLLTKLWWQYFLTFLRTFFLVSFVTWNREILISVNLYVEWKIHKQTCTQRRLTNSMDMLWLSRGALHGADRQQCPIIDWPEWNERITVKRHTERERERGLLF